MASRLRGTIILSSTIIPRTQRLLETGVLKQRPVWLDVVEAYPPLPPPPVPSALKKGKYPQIVYPEDSDDTESFFGPRVRGLAPNVTSLYESYSLVQVEHWKPDRFEDIEEEEELEKNIMEGKVEAVKNEVKARKEEQQLVGHTIAPDVQEKIKMGPKMEDPLPNFDILISELAEILKNEENKQ